MEMWFDNKSSLGYYGLDLQSCTITPPVRKRHLYSVSGSDGEIDLLKGMGPPRYEPRTVRATFKFCGADPRQDIDRLVNDLEGQTVPIVLPNDMAHYMIGDIHISSGSICAGGQVVIIATCMPWRFLQQETVIEIAASEENVVHTWYNAGKRDAVPKFTVNSAIDVTLGDIVTNYQPGTYLMTDLTIPSHDSVSVAIRGGSLTVCYKEAVL